MAAKYWLKMYHESLHDPKLASLPDNIWRRFWECCLMAGELDESGFLPALFEMSYTCRVSEDTIRAELGQMAQRGFVELKIDEAGQERWYVSNFEKRQSPSPTAERMKQYRKRKRKEAKEKEDTETDTYTDTYRTVTPVTNRNGSGKTIHTQEYLSPEIAEITAKLASISKDTLWAKTEDKFSDAAYSLFGVDDFKPDDISGFPEWWSVNGHYPGKPSLTSIMQNWKNYKAGHNPNGKQPETVTFWAFDEEEL